MATLDIRDNQAEPITKIVFGSDLSLEKHFTMSSVWIEDRDGEIVLVPLKDIDNLIKALHKAKELWSK